MVKVEIYKYKVTWQCYNCQKFNHFSENCSFNPVCVKCAGNHRAKDYSVKDRKDINCANCKEKYTANSVVALKALRIPEIVEFILSKKAKILSKLLTFNQMYFMQIW